MLTSLDKYQDDIRERLERTRIARQFQEPDRVPVAFGIGGSYYCWLQGVNIRDYYEDPELQVEVFLKGYEWHYEYLKADSSVYQSMGYDLGPLGESVVFGAEFVRPDNTSPRIVHCCDTLADALKLDWPAPDDNPRLAELVAKREQFAETARKIGVTIPCPVGKGIHVHPPLSCLCALLDNATVYEAMYAEPELLKRVLDHMYEAYIQYADHAMKVNGKLPSGITFGVCDDNVSQISGEMFREFELPYYYKLRDRYGVNYFTMHTDGPNDQHFKILADEFGLGQMDIGGFSKLENAVRDMKGKVYIHGGFNGKEFYTPDGLTDAVRRKALRLMKLAGPGGGFELAIGGETYIDVAPKALRELVELVQERGTYPIDISDDET